MRLKFSLTVIVASAVMANSRVYAESSQAAEAQVVPPVQGQIEARPPLEGGVEARSPIQVQVEGRPPLEGSAEARPPLQGGVERRVVPPPPPTLQPGFGKFGQDPLRGAVDQSSKPPLQGSVQDSKRLPLQGTVNDQGVSLGARVPNYSAIMRIVQFKKSDNTPQVVPPAITKEEIERARFRDDVNLSKAPLRTEEESQPRPVRGKPSDGPVRQTLSDGRPQRTALSVPQRQESGAPTRNLISIDAPPIRTIEGGWLTPPSRQLMDDQAPTSRVEMNPARISELPSNGANVRSGPDANSRLLQPAPNAEVVTAPQRANPNGFQEPSRKKKRDKKTNGDLKPNSSPQATQELAASADEMLLWDRWYQHMNDLLCQALRISMPRHGNPAGTNRVHITVWADHRLEAKLVESNNQNFDEAILEAYKSLSGSAELEFPRGTRRKQNDYETAHIQEIPAVTAAFDSRTVRGDLETLVK